MQKHRQWIEGVQIEYFTPPPPLPSPPPSRLPSSSRPPASRPLAREIGETEANRYEMRWWFSQSERQPAAGCLELATLDRTAT